MFTCVYLSFSSQPLIDDEICVFIFFQRSYAFERSDIERKENYVLKISYPFKVFCAYNLDSSPFSYTSKMYFQDQVLGIY